MKPFRLIIAALLLSQLCLAQDIVTLKDGTEIQSKILEVSEMDVKYKKWDYQDGPTFTISKSKIFMIKYQNGTKEVINVAVERAQDKEGRDSGSYRRNIISFNPLHLILGGNLSLSYETFTKKGRAGYRIPLSLPIIDNLSNQIAGGLDVKFYPTGQGTVKYFLGPSVIGGVDYYSDFFWGVLFNNGVAFQMGKVFNLTLDGAAGVSPHIYASGYTEVNFIWRIGLNCGFRF